MGALTKIRGTYVNVSSCIVCNDDSFDVRVNLLSSYGPKGGYLCLSMYKNSLHVSGEVDNPKQQFTARLHAYTLCKLE